VSAEASSHAGFGFFRFHGVRHLQAAAAHHRVVWEHAPGFQVLVFGPKGFQRFNRTRDCGPGFGVGRPTEEILVPVINTTEVEGGFKVTDCEERASGEG
jgi:hypothetical protein